MPESKKRKKVQQRRAANEQRSAKPQAPKTSPKWWVPLMVGFAVLGLLIVVVAYITGGRFPIPGLANGNINLFVGIGLMLVGFLMTMGWR